MLDSLNFDDLYQMSVNDSDSFWGTLAMQCIQWEVPFQKVCDCNMEEGLMRWFTQGKLNVSGKNFIVIHTHDGHYAYLLN